MCRLSGLYAGVGVRVRVRVGARVRVRVFQTQFQIIGWLAGGWATPQKRLRTAAATAVVAAVAAALWPPLNTHTRTYTCRAAGVAAAVWPPTHTLQLHPPHTCTQHAPVLGWPLWPIPQQGQHLLKQRATPIQEDAALQGEGANMLMVLQLLQPPAGATASTAPCSVRGQHADETEA